MVKNKLSEENAIVEASLFCYVFRMQLQLHLSAVQISYQLIEDMRYLTCQPARKLTEDKLQLIAVNMAYECCMIHVMSNAFSNG